MVETKSLINLKLIFKFLPIPALLCIVHLTCLSNEDLIWRYKIKNNNDGIIHCTTLEPYYNTDFGSIENLVQSIFSLL